MTKKIKTRMAPSPTGNLHIGGIRTTIFNYFFARQNDGVFVLRIDDTDTERNKKEYEDGIIETFKWLALEHDEFYRQSERTEIYKKYLQNLIDEDLAYEAEEAKDGSGKVIRFRNPNKKITIQDLIIGDVEIETEDLGDFVIAKNIDSPIYHFTNVVDDGEMEISHVIRGQEHLANTPRQILILEALGFERPEYAHIPLIMSPRGGKLSKRDPEVVPALEYKNMGILPEALLNFLAFIGWNPGGEKEIFSMEEMIKLFKLEKVQKGSGVFNVEKLHWTNRQYIQKMDNEEFLNYIDLELKEIKNLPKFSGETLNKILPIIKERIESYKDLKEMIVGGELTYYFEGPEIDLEKVIWKDDGKDKTTQLLNMSIDILEKVENWNSEEIKNAIWPMAEEEGKGSVLWPIRYTLSGKQKSPDPFTLLEVLGKDESILRLKKIVGLLG